MASRSWPHGTATTLSAVKVVPVGAPVVLVPVVLEVPAAVPVVPMVSVVPVVVSAVKVAVSAVPVVVLVVVGLVGLVVVVSVLYVCCFRGFAHRYQVAIVAEGHLLLARATFVVLFREGHCCHGQHTYHHHRSHHAKNRHLTAHPNFTPLCGWDLAVSLVGNIAGKGFLPAPWLTPAHSSVTTGVTSRICRMAIFWKAPRVSCTTAYTSFL